MVSISHPLKTEKNPERQERITNLPARSTRVRVERVWAAGWVRSRVSKAWEREEAWEWVVEGADTIRRSRPRSSNSQASRASRIGYRFTPVEEWGKEVIEMCKMKENKK